MLSESAPHSVELLSIIRVNKPACLDRTKYPFCRLDRTLCITTNDTDHPFVVLEASSPSERDRLVTALKLIVARLASIIIVRNEEMLMEFFSPYSALLHLDDEDKDHAEYSSDDQMEFDYQDDGHRHGHYENQSRPRYVSTTTATSSTAAMVMTAKNEKNLIDDDDDDDNDSPVVDIKRDTSDQEESDGDDLREGE